MTMHRTVVLDVVGLTGELIGDARPALLVLLGVAILILSRLISDYHRTGDATE